MTRLRGLVSALIIGCFSIGAVGCLDVDEDIDDRDDADEVYLEAGDVFEVPDEPLRAQLPPDSYLEPADSFETPSEPLLAELPPFPDDDTPEQPDASLLEAGDGLSVPTEPLRAELPDPDQDDLDDDDARDQGTLGY